MFTDCAQHWIIGTSNWLNIPPFQPPQPPPLPLVADEGKYADDNKGQNKEDAVTKADDIEEDF